MTTITDTEALRARKCWRTLEPYHGFVYFAAEPAEEYAALGITGRSGYFVSRSAAMGRVTTPTVQATFFNFHPELVARAMADAPDWDPDTVGAARLRGVDRVLRHTLGEEIHSEGMARAATLALRATDGLADRCAGRPLGAAHAALPVPDEPHLQLWWAITALREYRGDGHIAALVDAELSGLEALVVHAASGEVGADVLRSTRARGEDEWNRAVASLAARGLLHPDGTFTDAGADVWRHVEDRTDRLAAPAWARLTHDEGTELRALVRPWSSALFSGLGG